MFPGVNPRDMQKAMKRLGIKQEEIDAEVVIIKTPDKDLIIKKPHVTKVNMMGQETFQIVGEINEVDRNDSINIGDDDLQTVMEQTSCNKEEAQGALEESNGNIAEAILKLQNK